MASEHAKSVGVLKAGRRGIDSVGPSCASVTHTNREVYQIMLLTSNSLQTHVLPGVPELFKLRPHASPGLSECERRTLQILPASLHRRAIHLVRARIRPPLHQGQKEADLDRRRSGIRFREDVFRSLQSFLAWGEAFRVVSQLQALHEHMIQCPCFPLSLSVYIYIYIYIW